MKLARMFDVLQGHVSGISPRSSPLATAGERATLRVGGSVCWLVVGDVASPRLCRAGATAAETLATAAAAAREWVAERDGRSGRSADQPTDDHFRWRLVLSGGYHHLAAIPAARWSEAIAQSVGFELEAACPASLDELVTATLPVGLKVAWTVALERSRVEEWCVAAAARGMELEGIWTCASAMIEAVMEGPAVPDPMAWGDAEVTVQAWPAAADGAPEVAARSSGFRAIRVVAGRASTPTESSLCAGADPASSAHRLERIDPSESFNLARGDLASPVVLARRQAPFVRGCAVLAVAVLLWSALALWLGQVQSQRAAAYAVQTRKLVQMHAPDAAASPMPIEALVTQAAGWRTARERGILPPPRSQLTSMGKWLGALPKDLPVNITRVRAAGRDVWLEGQVKSQNDARVLLDALSKAQDMRSDSVRTSSAADGLVTFSVRLVMPR